jgi:hypothetical protein
MCSKQSRISAVAACSGVPQATTSAAMHAGIMRHTQCHVPATVLPLACHLLVAYPHRFALSIRRHSAQRCGGTVVAAHQQLLSLDAPQPATLCSFCSRVLVAADAPPRWRFSLQQLAGGHWVAVARGPPDAMWDPYGVRNALHIVRLLHRTRACVQYAAILPKHTSSSPAPGCLAAMYDGTSGRAWS